MVVQTAGLTESSFEEPFRRAVPLRVFLQYLDPEILALHGAPSRFNPSQLFAYVGLQQLWDCDDLAGPPTKRAVTS